MRHVIDDQDQWILRILAGLRDQDGINKQQESKEEYFVKGLPNSLTSVHPGEVCAFFVKVPTVVMIPARNC